MTVLARHVICVLHDDPAALESVVAAYPGFSIDHEFSTTEPDARMRSAFDASMDRVEPSMEASDWDAIEGHQAVTYVMSPPIAPDEARAISAAALQLVGDVFAAGARAVKGESSGIAHGAARWNQLVADLASDDEESPAEAALYVAWVRRPISDDEVAYTCGMHLLGLPDVEIERPSPDELDDHGVVQWLDAFALYELIEVEQSAFEDGHTFRPDPESARRTLRRVECHRYESDDFFYNPHGSWRIEATKATKAAKAKPKAKATKATKAKATKAKPTKAKPTAKAKGKPTKAKAKAAKAAKPKKRR